MVENEPEHEPETAVDLIDVTASKNPILASNINNNLKPDVFYR